MALSKAAFHSNAKVKANIVLVGSVEEKRAEGSYFTLSDDHWVALGDDALDAQRKLMATNAQREFQRLSQNPKQRESPVSAVSNGRELIREEIERYLEGLVAAKRPAKSARMNRNFLNAFVDLAKKQYTDEYGRDDVIEFGTTCSRRSTSTSTSTHRWTSCLRSSSTASNVPSSWSAVTGSRLRRTLPRSEEHTS